MGLRCRRSRHHQTLPNSATVTYVYDNDRELTDTTDADSRRTTYSYDADGDQTGETWVGASPSEKITYTYRSFAATKGLVGRELRLAA